MKRLLVLAAVLLPYCIGCVTIPYPTLALVPEMTVPNPDGSVHVFRVDSNSTSRPCEPRMQYELSRIPIDASGVIPCQFELKRATGVFNPFGLEDVPGESNQYSMLVRAYRSGYHTIEVKGWGNPRELNWTPATDLAAQEKAIDHLLVAADRDPAVNWPAGTHWWGNEPILSSTGIRMTQMVWPKLLSGPGQRDALLFAVAEYERLAKSAAMTSPGMEKTRDRLEGKIRLLKYYASEPTGDEPDRNAAKVTSR